MKDVVIKSLKKYVGLSQKEFERLIEIPPSSELGDYSFPCFTLSKQHKQAPNKIAEQLAKKIKSPNFEKVDAKGPYLNFFLNRKKLADKTLKEILKEKGNYGKINISKEKIMVEFSQPNTHKAFHVGHVRGTSLGESISRIHEAVGNKVIRANYSGDTGMHIAKWLWCYQKFHSKEKLSDEESWIAKVYVDAVKKLAENKDYQLEVEEINRKLESREDKKLNELWEKTKKASINAWKKIYKELQTHFNVHYFESNVELPGKKIAQDLVKKKIAKISEGATIIDFKDYNKENLAVFLMLRKDGTVLYGGKDLYLAEKKFKDYNLDKSYYMIGREQDLYIHQVFETLKLMKSKAANKSYYVPVLEIRLPTGKMSSRTGDNVLYSEFKRELTEYAKFQIEKREEKKSKDQQNRAEIIAIAALKYSMLKQDLNKSIVFDKTEALKFEGNTGPYLLYTYARAKSILRKAKSIPKKLKINQLNNSEKSLILKLSKFPEVVEKSYKNLAPNLIANYAYEISQEFNEFYHKNKVVGSENENLRLNIVQAFSEVLKNSLNLLAIPFLEKM